MLSNAQELFQIYKNARANMGMRQKANYVQFELVRPVVKEEPQQVEQEQEQEQEQEPEIIEKPIKLTKWQLRKLRQALDDALNANNDNEKIYRPKMATIIKAVTKEFKVTYNDLISHRKYNEIVIPRFVVIYLARRLTLLSTTGIGKSLGKRDHSTIIHALRRMNEILNEDDDLLERVLRLEELLKKDPDDAKS
jgi:hypothetical protein